MVRARTSNAYALLHSLSQLPGFNAASRTLDKTILEDWVMEARKICEAAGYLQVADSRIGELVAHAHEEKDGLWPPIGVREIIDMVDSESLQRGFLIGILKKRGVYMKSPYEGGESERQLAEQLFKCAAAVSAEWPATAAALGDVAQHYVAFAAREDEEAEIHRR